MNNRILKTGSSRRYIDKALRSYLREKPQVDAISLCRGGFFNITARVRLKNHKPLIIQFSPANECELFWHEQSMLRRTVYFLDYLKASSLPVARVYYYDFSRHIVPCDFVILEELPGSNWHYYGRRLSSKENQSIYTQLGEYAKQIHSIKGNLRQFGFPKPYKSFSRWSEFVLAYTKNLNIHNAHHRLLQIDEKFTPYSIAQRLCHSLDKITEPRLVQGDLWPRNILIKESRGKYFISGILDWERGLWGDPQFEWVLQCMNYGKAFWNAYGWNNHKTSQDFVLRSKLYQACFIFQAALEEIYYFKQKKKASGLIKKMTNIINQFA